MILTNDDLFEMMEQSYDWIDYGYGRFNHIKSYEFAESNPIIAAQLLDSENKIKTGHDFIGIMSLMDLISGRER